MLEGMVLEVVLHFYGRALVSHGHQGLELWPLQHFRSYFFAVQRVIDPLFHVSLLFLRSPLGELSLEGFKLLVCHFVRIDVLLRGVVGLDHDVSELKKII